MSLPKHIGIIPDGLGNWSLAVDQCDKEYARAEALDAKLKEAVSLLRGSDATFERLGYTPASIARESINTFLASLEGDKP